MAKRFRDADDIDKNVGKIRCPKDATLMERETVGGSDKGGAGVALDRCARCGAIWLDAFELEKLLSMQNAAKKADIGPIEGAEPGSSLGEHCCPRDATPLKVVHDPVQVHVRLESCETCNGKLLDAGEILDLSVLTLFEKLRSFVG